MSDLPLPGLTDKDDPDPENFLSTEARQRIARALLEYEQVRRQARSAIELGGYWGTPQAFIDMREADMEAARIVIRAEAEEYGRLGLPASRFREIMQTRIEGMVYSLEFSNMQRDALDTEFLWPAHREPEDKPGSVGRSAVERVGASMTEHQPINRTINAPEATARVVAYMACHCLTQVEFADRAHISERTLRRLLQVNTASIRTWVEVANALGTTSEELLNTGHSPVI